MAEVSGPAPGAWPFIPVPSSPCLLRSARPSGSTQSRRLCGQCRPLPRARQQPVPPDAFHWTTPRLDYPTSGLDYPRLDYPTSGLPTSGLPHVWTTPRLDYPTSGLPHVWTTPRLDYPTSGLPTSGLPHVWTTPRLDYPTSGLPHVWTTPRPYAPKPTSRTST